MDSAWTALAGSVRTVAGQGTPATALLAKTERDDRLHPYDVDRRHPELWHGGGELSHRSERVFKHWSRTSMVR